jgi:adenine phosphoribosyltransferase
MDLRQVIRAVPDFPRPGILFRDIAPVLADPAAFRAAIDALAAIVSPLGANKLAAIESRGFLFAAPLADRLGLGLIPLRKPGKLPGAKISLSYALEYGEATLEMQTGALRSGERVVVVDDLLATGGTAEAAGRLLGQAGGRLSGFVFLVELAELGGRRRLLPAPVFAVVSYDRRP